MVKTRIAPSPTGEDLHVGNAYTALLNYTFAKKNKGKFIVRIEDTDQKRKVAGSEKKIFESLKWLGFEPDEKPVRQSERLGLYQKYARELVDKKSAYYKEKAIRLKMPKDGETVFRDFLRGEIRFQNKLIDDQVILKSDGYPTYHLAVVVDDYLMKITHIIRGEEWISSVPKHIQIYKALGWKPPIFAHTPLLRNPDKSKLSKRKNPVWVGWYKEQGILPEALVNYLGILGYSMPDEREIFSLPEFIDEFDLKRIGTSAPVFDMTKLEWINGEYIRKLKVKSLKSKVMNLIGGGYDDNLVEKTIPLIQTRIKKLSDYLPMCGFFFRAPADYKKDINKEWIIKVIEKLKLTNEWRTEKIHKSMEDLAKKLALSRGKLFMDIRIALTGKKIGPPLFESMEILGKKESIKRLLSNLGRF